MKMARIEIVPEVLDDFERIFEHQAQYTPDDAAARINEIVKAIAVLVHNPRIGRLAPNGKRELVIGRKSHGYIALYRYVDRIDTVFVLAGRSQRGAGYSRL
jgi:plasmid stabilization system protein ParE